MYTYRAAAFNFLSLDDQIILEFAMKTHVSFKDRKLQAIHDTFVNPDSPACFSSAQNVWTHVKKRFRGVTLEEVLSVLEQIPAFTKHRGRRIIFPRLKTVPRGYMTHVQVDLADFQKVAHRNDNFKYILVRLIICSLRFS